MTNKVYIPNNSGHDFSQALEYGHLVFVTEGMIDRFKVNQMYREVARVLENSHENDHIIVSGLTQINVILCSAFAWKHGRLNLLLYDVKEETYIQRKIVLENLLIKDEEDNGN